MTDHAASAVATMVRRFARSAKEAKGSPAVT